VLVFLFSKTVRRIAALLVIVPALVIAVTASRVWWVARQDDRGHADAIVVLGASQYDGRPSAVFRARLEHAASLFEQEVAPRVVTLGAGAPGDRFTEAGAGARFLQANGVTSVVAVPEGRDTLQSMKALDRLFRERGWDSAVIVTDPWHALRSRRMARDLGIDAHTSPTRHGPAVRTRGTEARYIARETAAYLYYRLFHRSSEAGPHAV
jgi:uncharacterized SAM-binding protein YcdF (DUF218 family)